MTGDDEDWPFDRAVIDAAATDHGVDPDELQSLIAEHQDSMAALPGVENLVYEWRKQFDATVLARSPTAYYVAAPEWIWDEFGDHLGVDDRELAAIATVHRRTIRRVGEVEEGALASAAGCVLLRTS